MKLHIEKAYSEPYFDTYIVEGLSVKEMGSILDVQSFEEMRKNLVVAIDSHENDLERMNLGAAWMCGYGIYDIRHVGGHLIVKVGNSCD